MRLPRSCITTRAPLLSPFSLGEHNPTSFKEYVTSLYQRASNNPSTIPEISITFGSRVIVRVKRTPKYVTTHELTKLAEDYSKSKEEITQIFQKRKIEVRNEA